MSSSRITAYAQILLMSIVSVPALSQDKRPAMPGSGQELLLRLLAARESTVQYAVEANISEKTRTFGDKNWVAPANRQNIKMYLEYSKIDDHFVVALQKSPGHQRYEGWAISGRSKDIFLQGSSNRLNLHDYVSGMESTEMLEHFDPMQIGFFFCMNWLYPAHSGLEKRLSGNTKELPPNSGSIEIKENQDGTFEFLYIGGYVTERYHIDASRNYWVVYSEIKQEFRRGKEVTKDDFSVETTVSLEKRHDMYVPNLVQMFCKEPSRKLETYYLVTLDWESVNQPISTGRECAPRLLERLGGNGTVNDLSSARK